MRNPPFRSPAARRTFVAPPWLASVVLVVAIALAYANSLRAPFLFDDAGAVVNNSTIRRLASLEVLRPPADGTTTTGRPVVNLSFALNYALSGESVWGYHATNVAIHALNALVLFGLLRRAFSTLNSRPSTLNSSAFLTALLWALHPLQTESVVCIAQRTETLCGLFYLLTLYTFTRATVPLGGGACFHRRAWLVVSVIACGAGMATKEVMVTAPLVVFLFDRTFVAGTFAAAWRARRGYYLALAATWTLLGWLVLRGEGARGVAAGFGLGVSWWTYLLKQCEALVLYLRLSFWPHPLVLDYGSAVVQSPADVWWQGVIVLLLLAVTGWAMWRRPVMGFVGAWFFLILAPSSSVVPLVTQTMAEHRMYLPLAAVMSVAVAGAFLLLRRRSLWLLGAVAGVLAVGTVARNRDYRDAVTVWSSSVAGFPHSARAQNNLGLALHQAHRPAEAERHFARAIALDPDYVSARYNWGVALLEQGRLDDAIRQLEAAVRLAPKHADAHVNLGNALVQARRPAEAIPHYEQALRLEPAADAHYNLGIAYADAGRLTAAVEQFQSALRLNPRLPEAHFQLARWHEREGRSAEAEQHYGITLQIAPEHAAAHARLGLLYARGNRLDEAARHLREAMRLRPADADARANLGNVLLLQDRPRDALTVFEEALRLRPNDARLRESIRTAQEALR